jgi:hypothetical protein
MSALLEQKYETLLRKLKFSSVASVPPMLCMDAECIEDVIEYRNAIRKAFHEFDERLLVELNYELRSPISALHARLELVRLTDYEEVQAALDVSLDAEKAVEKQETENLEGWGRGRIYATVM